MASPSWVALLLASVAASAAATALGHDKGAAYSVDPETAAESELIPGAFIFEFEDGLDQSDFYRALGKEGEARVQYNYKLFSGVSVQLNKDDADEKAKKMASLPAVKKMWPVEVFTLPQQAQLEGEVQWETGHNTSHAMKQGPSYVPHVMTQIDKLHKKGYTGKGIKVAIIDTGIDYKHHDLGGCFGKGCLVSFGYDLVGNNYDGTNLPKPSNDPMDCHGHGTFAAGIVAAQGGIAGIKGAAPGVNLGAYRAVSCAGKTSSDILMAAWIKAYEDGAPIISSSISLPGGWAASPFSTVVSRIAAKGIPCIVTAGHSAPEIMYRGDPSPGHGVISVGAVHSTQEPRLAKRAEYVLDGGESTEFNFFPGTPDDWSTRMDLYAAGDGACIRGLDNIPNLSDKVVLIRQWTHGGRCSDKETLRHLALRGLRYVLFYSEQPRTVATKGGIKAVGYLSQAVGEAFEKHLRAGKVTLDFQRGWRSKSGIEVVENPVGGCVAHFSGWGPTWDLHFTPQYCAIGGDMASTYLTQKGSYSVQGDFGMAAYMAAGIVALIGEVRKSLDSTLITALISATAKPALESKYNRYPESVRHAIHQGGGLVQAYDAAFATTLLEPSSLSFNDTDHSITSLDFVLKNTGKREVEYEFITLPYSVKHFEEREGASPRAVSGSDFGPEPVELSQRSVKLAPGMSVKIKATPDPPEMERSKLAYWSGYIRIRGSDGTQLSLPYQGVAGSLYESNSLKEASVRPGPKVESLGQEGGRGDAWLLPRPGTATDSDQYLRVMTALRRPSAHVRYFLEQQEGGDGIKAGAEERTEQMQATTAELFGSPLRYQGTTRPTLGWDGRLARGGYAAAGKYRMVVQALRTFGNATKEGDHMTGRSSVFEIRYR